MVNQICRMVFRSFVRLQCDGPSELHKFTFHCLDGFISKYSGIDINWKRTNSKVDNRWCFLNFHQYWMWRWLQLWKSFEFAGFVEILNNGTVSGRNSMTFVVMVVFVCGITETYARVHVCSCGCLPLRAPAVLKHNISIWQRWQHCLIKTMLVKWSGESANCSGNTLFFN